MLKSWLVLFAVVVGGVSGIAGTWHYLKVESPQTGAAVDTHGFFFDNNTGDDANPCSYALPCRTIAHANSLVYPPNSTIAFRQGQTFKDATLTLSASNVLGPIKVTSYGDSVCSVVARAVDGCATIALSGTETKGIGISNLSNWRVENIRIVGGLPYLSKFQGSECVYYEQNYGINANGFISNVECIDTALEFYFNKVGGIFSGASVIDSWLHGSIVTAPVDIGIYTHFINGPITIQGNVIQNIGGHPNNTPGFYLGGTGNAILIAGAFSTGSWSEQFNVASDIGANATSCGGPAAIWTYDTQIPGITAFNEVFRTEPIPTYRGGCDFDAFDIDGGNSGTVLEYNYAHDNAGACINLFQAKVAGHPWRNNVVRYNICEDNARSVMADLNVTGENNVSTNSLVYNNTFYSSNGKHWQCVSGTKNSDIQVYNNICYALNEATMVYDYSGAEFKLDYNDYYVASGAMYFNWRGQGAKNLAAWQAVSGQDDHSQTIDPKLSLPGGDVTCWSGKSIPTRPHQERGCPEGYRLRAKSPMIGAGLNLTGPPHNQTVDRDYYGRALPHQIGAGWNIGADGGAW